MSNNLEKYLKVRENLDTGDALIWDCNLTFHPKSWIPELIKIWSPGANHASLVYNEFDDKNMSNKFILEALGSGVELRRISQRLGDYNGKVYWLKAKPFYDNLRDEIGAWALDKVGTRYDYKSIVHNIFGRVSADASLLFCSEFVYLAWRKVHIRRLKIKCTKHNIKLPKMQDTKVFNFKKAPRPSDLYKMGIWEEPVRIL